jgi:hypothetical protein
MSHSTTAYPPGETPTDGHSSSHPLVGGVAVLADLDAWLPHVRAGGWVCGHDCHLPDVKRAVHERFGSLVVVAGASTGSGGRRSPPAVAPRPDFAVIPQPPRSTSRHAPGAWS